MVIHITEEESAIITVLTKGVTLLYVEPGPAIISLQPHPLVCVHPTPNEALDGLLEQFEGETVKIFTTAEIVAQGWTAKLVIK